MKTQRFEKGDNVPINLLKCDYPAVIKFGTDVLVEIDDNGYAHVYPDDEDFNGYAFSTHKGNCIVKVSGIPDNVLANIDGCHTTWYMRPKGYDYTQEYELI